MAKAIGIDLGTDNYCVAAKHCGKIEIIPDELGNRVFPAWVSFTSEGVLFGQSARHRVDVDPSNTVYNVLQLVGRRRKDILDLIQKLPYEVVESGVNGRLKINVLYNDQPCSFFPEEILAILLSRIKQMAEAFLGHKVEKAVVSCPHSFKLPQIQALRTAAEIVGLDAKFSSSSALAALAFGVQHHIVERDYSFVVFSMGSYNVEASVVTVEGDRYQVQSAVGSRECGGEALTDALVNYIKKCLQRKGLALSHGKKTLSILREECEKMKKMLSTNSVAYFSMESVINTGSLQHPLTVTRESFEELATDLFLSAIDTINEALCCANLNGTREVVIVGGSVRVPKIQELLYKTYHCFPNKSLNLDEAVAIGAAMKAENIWQTEANVEVSIPLLLEVAHHSIGIETDQGAIVPIINKNDVLPVANGTCFDRGLPDVLQPIVINMYEGENSDIRGNTFIGEATIKNTSVQKLNIILELDQSHVLTVKAEEALSSALVADFHDICVKQYSLEEIDFMKARNRDIEEVVKKRIQYMDSRNKLEGYVISIKKDIEGGLLEDECARILMDKCTEVLEQLENMKLLTAEEIELVYLQLQQMYQQQTQVTQQKRDDQVRKCMYRDNKPFHLITVF